MNDFDHLPPEEQEEISTEAMRIRTMIQAGVALDGVIYICEELGIRPDSTDVRAWLRKRQRDQIDFVLRTCSDMSPDKASKIARYLQGLDQ